MHKTSSLHATTTQCCTILQYPAKCVFQLICKSQRDSAKRCKIFKKLRILNTGSSLRYMYYKGYDGPNFPYLSALLRKATFCKNVPARCFKMLLTFITFNHYKTLQTSSNFKIDSFHNVRVVRYGESKVTFSYLSALVRMPTFCKILWHKLLMSRSLQMSLTSSRIRSVSLSP